MTTDKKIAIVLFNLGGPTGPKTIRPFLMNFFMDKNIIPWPKPLRFLLANFIATLRSRGPAKTAYGEMGGGSPLLENTIAQAKALEKQFEGNVRVYTCMRYWHPMAESVAPEVQAFNPDELILVSLYPQMSSTTFWSSLSDWQENVAKIGYDKKPTVICCYPTLDGFISASIKNIKAEIDKCVATTGKLPRILFSAHSLPLKVIQNGDPYEWQCNQTAQAIIKELNIPNLDTVISYQSKVGPQTWLGPQTEDEIKRAGHDQVPMIVYPHAFVSEHVETIVELGIEYREVAEHHGVPYYGVVPTVGTHPEFIAGLASQIKSRLGQPGIFSDAPDGCAICPQQFNWCCQRRAKAEHVMEECCHG
jgi:ferrochelatase